MTRLTSLVCLLTLIVPSLAVAQDADGDLFDVSLGDCDDADGSAFPGSTEVCDGSDEDCDGVIDEPGASPFQCDPFPILVEAPDNTIDGNLIMVTEVFQSSVDFTGIPLWQDTLIGTTTPGGVLPNVQSILVRNWMGSSSSNVIANATLTVPAGVTIHGWVIDFGTATSDNRNLDATFSVTGGSLVAGTNNTWFENGTQDWAWVNGNQAGFRSYIASAADEARLIVSYDPATVGNLDVSVNMGGGIIRDLSWCGTDMPGLTNHVITLATADNDLLDDDGDGVTECDGDCDDANALVGPGFTELCDGLDNDCDGVVPATETDDDGDGVAECAGDCDDADPTVVPGAAELCDGLDNGCGGISSEETDDDGDGFFECQGDCDDAEPAAYPGATELCDGIDNDCNGVIFSDEQDLDGDGYAGCDGDCDDADPGIFPLATEACDGIDTDCDGVIPADELDADGDGLPTCGGDCDDLDPTTAPGLPELCDGVDNDCDTLVPPDEVDGDGDGVAVCGGDCDDADAAVFPGAAEVCNGLDDDCDGLVPAPELDADGDGQEGCNGDCDDS
ncbi:MAG: putative metal-binding motif-containing protein, partial [Deltaproteobacteria bacterium]|nr:putative metal-binding motif-containing protein [Deltaproteobacteria bacterium]